MLTPFVGAQTNNDRGKTFVTGAIYDSNGALIVGTDITFTDKKGKIFHVKADQNGNYIVALDPSGPYGRPDGNPYSIEVKANGFETFRMGKYSVPYLDKGQMRLDIMLPVLVIVDIIEVRSANKKKP